MPANKKQILRMIKLVAMLKRNSYPNATSFVKILREADLMENLNIACTERTFMRDIATLKLDFKAPIEFDHEHNGYCLTRPDWEFQTPTLTDDALLTAMLGGRVAEDVLPSPLKEKVTRAVDSHLAVSDTSFFDRTFLESLLVASGSKTSIAPEIFEALFQGWRNRLVLHLTYKKGATGEIQEYDFEPHILASFKGNWYVKGYPRNEKKPVCLAIFRIQQACKGHGTFLTDKKLIEDTRKNGLFDYPKIEGITVRCVPAIAYYLYEQERAKNLKITPQQDGSLIVILPPSPEYEALRWILGEGGNVEVLQPVELRKKVRDMAQKCAEINA